ncbi:MAG: hypothetical protein ACRC26_09010, partial [Bacteroidales bacterium]
MRKVFIPIMLFCTIIANAQEIDSLLQKQRSSKEDLVLESLNEISRNTEIEKSNYKLYPTQNIWIFLKLDTRNGRIWQVQFYVGSEDRNFQSIINSEFLCDGIGKSSRFELYPTDNLYNFLLLDKESG